MVDTVGMVCLVATVDTVGRYISIVGTIATEANVGR